MYHFTQELTLYTLLYIRVMLSVCVWLNSWLDCKTTNKRFTLWSKFEGTMCYATSQDMIFRRNREPAATCYYYFIIYFLLYLTIEWIEWIVKSVYVSLETTEDKKNEEKKEFQFLNEQRSATYDYGYYSYYWIVR